MDPDSEAVRAAMGAMKVSPALSNSPNGSPQKEKTVLFETIDPGMSGWGRVVPNFYNSLFL